jgi:hypothetical protein
MKRWTHARPARGRAAAAMLPDASKSSDRIRNLAFIAMIALAAVVGARAASAQTGAATPGAEAKEYHTRFRSEAGDGLHVVEIEGRVRFGADASRIEWMADGAYVLVVSGDQDRTTLLRAEPDRDGRPEYRYEVDGQASRSAADRDRWLADTLPVVFRELGFDVDARLQAAYDQGGADGVFRTVAAIRSDYSTGLHYMAFFGRKDLRDDEIIGALAHAGIDLENDVELAKILYSVVDHYRDRPAVRAGFLACLARIDSERERASVTRNLFGTDEVTGDVAPAMLASAGGC